jgi:hypothetical protein
MMGFDRGASDHAGRIERLTLVTGLKIITTLPLVRKSDMRSKKNQRREEIDENNCIGPIYKWKR